VAQFACKLGSDQHSIGHGNFETALSSMPYRSLKQADLKPVVHSPLRTVPRAALVMTLSAQVIVWGTLIVASFVFLRPFQTAAEAYELTLSTPVWLLVRLAEFVRAHIGWTLGVLLCLFGLEVYYFVRRRPFAIKRSAWLALMCGSLLLPFFLMLIGGMLVLQAWAKLFTTLS